MFLQTGAFAHRRFLLAWRLYSTHRRFYTQAPSHTHTHTHTHACSHRKPPHAIFSQTRAFQMLLRRESCCTLTFCAFKLYALYFRRFLHAENFYRRVSSHLNAFTRRKPCTQELLGAEAFTHRCVYTYVLTRKQRASPFSQRLWHTGAFTQSTRKLLHTAVANKCFCTQKFLRLRFYA